MNIGNYYQYNEMLASGAQPTEEQIKDLKTKGFEVIVNISTSTARNALNNEAKLVEAQSLDYIHFPVDCGNLRPIHYKTFKGIMQGIDDKKTFVHCAGNIKSSNLLHMYLVLEKGISEKESFETLLKIQNPEQKWIKYFENFGINNN